MKAIADMPMPDDDFQSDVIGPIRKGGQHDLYAVTNETVAKYERIARLQAARRKSLEERKAAEEKRFQAALAIPVRSADPEQVTVRAGDIEFDRRYQTPERYNEGRAKRIAETYEHSRCRAISINIRPGDPTETIWCFDGKHRVEATRMKLGMDHRMRAELHRVPYEEEARLFADQDKDVKKVPQTIKFIALVEAGDNEALAQQALAQRLGIALGSQARDRQIALNSFLDCYRLKGEVATEAGIGFVLDAWHGKAQSLESHIVKGLVWFVACRANDPNYDQRRVHKVLSRITFTDLELMATVYGSSGTHPQRIAAAVVDLYNANRKSQQILAPWNMRIDK